MWSLRQPLWLTYSVNRQGASKPYARSPNLLDARSAITHTGLKAVSGQTKAPRADALGATRREDFSMIQTSVAVPMQARPQPDLQQLDTKENDLLDPLWRLAGDLSNARTLIVARQGLDLMCGLIRRGCLAATVLRPGDKPDSNDYDLVVVPLVAALPSADAVIRLARQALAPNGRLIAGVSNTRAAVALVRRLRLNGFSTLQSTHLSGFVLLHAGLRRPS
jgi:hypothetical protein